VTVALPVMNASQTQAWQALLEPMLAAAQRQRGLWVVVEGAERGLALLERFAAT
jgi:hypothetical protein